MQTQTETLVGQQLVCSETGKPFIGAVVDGFTANYATDSDGNVYSDEGGYSAQGE